LLLGQVLTVVSDRCEDQVVLGLDAVELEVLGHDRARRADEERE
jgi:hypothetical protein